MSETPELTAFVLDGRQGHPAILPAAVREDGAAMTLALTHPEGHVTEVASTAALPGTDLAALEETFFHDGSPMWVASLCPEAPAGLWVRYWTHHCPAVDLIFGLWPPRPEVRALHVRGRNTAGMPVVVSVPLLDPGVRDRVAELVETDQAALLAEACGWN